MLEILQHTFGLCGEQHPTIFAMLILTTNDSISFVKTKLNEIWLSRKRMGIFR